MVPSSNLLSPEPQDTTSVPNRLGWGLGFRVCGLGFEVQGLGFKVCKLGFRVRLQEYGSKRIIVLPHYRNGTHTVSIPFSMLFALEWSIIIGESILKRHTPIPQALNPETVYPRKP